MYCYDCKLQKETSDFQPCLYTKRGFRPKCNQCADSFPSLEAARRAKHKIINDACRKAALTRKALKALAVSPIVVVDPPAVGETSFRDVGTA